MSSIGNFELLSNILDSDGSPNSSSLNLSDSDNELLTSLLMPGNIIEETNTDEIIQYLAQGEVAGDVVKMVDMESVIKETNKQDLGVPETPTSPHSGSSRFKKVTEAQLKKYEDMTQSKSTKKKHKMGSKTISR